MKHMKSLAALCLGAALLLTGCGQSQSPEVVENPAVSVGDVAFTMEDYTAIYLFSKNSTDMTLAQQGLTSEVILSQEGGKEFYHGQIALPAMQQLEFVAALESLMRQEKLTLDQSKVDELTAQQEENLGGAEPLDVFLQGMQMSREQFSRFFMAPDVMIEQLVNHFADSKAKEIRANFEDKFLRCKHVLLNEEAGSSEREALANEITEKARNNADFDDLIAQYNEDPGMSANPDGYVFTEGTMVDEFYQGTKALEMNGISDPVRSSFGWHIIQRLPIDDEIYEAHKAEAQQEYLFTQADAWLKDAKIEASPEAKALTFEDLLPEAEKSDGTADTPNEAADTPDTAPEVETPAAEN